MADLLERKIAGGGEQIGLRMGDGNGGVSAEDAQEALLHEVVGIGVRETRAEPAPEGSFMRQNGGHEPVPGV